MADFELSRNCREAIHAKLGNGAGTELLNLLQRMADRIDELDRGKIDVIPVGPQPKTPDSVTPRRRAA